MRILEYKNSKLIGYMQASRDILTYFKRKQIRTRRKTKNKEKHKKIRLNDTTFNNII